MGTKNIHDTFFKDAFTDKALAVDFLKNYLPPSIAEHVRLDTLTITKDTFIDKKWDDYYSDLLYMVTFADGRPGFVYFLFEHKSYHDHFLTLQMLRYILEIWELYRKQHKNTRSLPLIIPISIYHGQNNRSALRVAELVDLPSPNLDIYVPDFEISFYDFSPGSEQDIKGAITLKLILSCFRAKNLPESLHHLFEILTLLNKLDNSETGLKWMEVIFRYMLETMDINEHDLREMAQKALDPGKEDTIMTLADRLRKEGEEKGLEKGIVKGHNELFNRLLHKKFGDIRDPHIQKRLRNATPDQIDRWFDRILEAKSIEDVIKE
ncbi:MAG TPA: Rpn family recombination-promoting nuclease/putative transposase [Desulfomicrobiaceae bacterium]|nr:Rpn family recombination-promoting nuclease/putative transposase [Desulfomicrobiaceae bacterium]